MDNLLQVGAILDTHGLRGEVKVLNERTVLFVAEGDVAQLDIALYVFERSVRVGSLTRLIEQAENAGGTRQRILHLCNDRTNVIERFHILVRIR